MDKIISKGYKLCVQCVSFVLSTESMFNNIVSMK